MSSLPIKDRAKWRIWLYETIFGIETVAGRVFDLGLLIAIIASIIVVLLESVPTLPESFDKKLITVEWIMTILFSLEYVARIIASPSPKKYIFSALGIIDLLSIVPTFISPFIAGANSLLVLRAMRLVRIFRILKLTRYMSGADHLAEALIQSRHKIVVFLGSVMCIVSVMGSVLFVVEGGQNGFSSIPTSIYWAIVTLTTVGYGDIAPQTPLGQATASVIMILGYAILAVPTGIVTHEMSRSGKGRSCTRCATISKNNDANYCYKCGERLPHS